MSRLLRLTLAVIVVVVVVGVVAFRPHESTCAKESKQAAGVPTHTSGTGERVFILGDSWASGWHLPNATDSFAFQLAGMKHWDTTVSAFPGTGYVNPGSCGGHTYAQRLQGLTVTTQLVLLEGGLNDVGQPQREQAAVTDTLRVIHRLAPAAQVVIVGPTLAPLQPAADVRRIIDAQRATGAQFVDLEGLSLPYQPDRLHPTVTGAQQLARYLASARPLDNR